MSGRIFTFGEKIPLEIDKLDGFRVGNTEPRVRIRGWDEFHFSGQVEGILSSGNRQLLEGVILTEEEIREIFTPFPNPHRELSRTIAMRSGNYGKPKNAGRIRLETRDAESFSLVLTTPGEQRIRTIGSIDGRVPESLYLDVHCNGRNRKFVMYQQSLHGGKIQKILDQNQN